MIIGLTGIIHVYQDGVVTYQVGDVLYEILVPSSYGEHFKDQINSGLTSNFIIYHYLQVTQSTATPILIGFLSHLDKGFFLELIKVNGIGPRTAIKMMSKHVEELAALIDSGDKDQLKKIPGISLQRALDMINKLGGKLKDYHVPMTPLDPKKGPYLDASVTLKALTNLGYSRIEAKSMVEKAIERNKDINNNEELILEVFKKNT